jgi:hypothetical protein
MALPGDGGGDAGAALPDTPPLSRAASYGIEGSYGNTLDMLGQQAESDDDVCMVRRFRLKAGQPALTPPGCSA